MPSVLYSGWALAALACSFLFARIIRPLALRCKYVDHPAQAPERKLHQKSIPYGGGIAIALTMAIIVAAISIVGLWPSPQSIASGHLVGVLAGGAVLLLGGILDDYYSLSPRAQLVWSLAAIAVVIGSGIGVSSARLPWGSILRFGAWSTIVTTAWLLLVMYSTKLFDGLDGLVTGIGAIGGCILFAVSLLPVLNQPQNALVAIVFACACMGFLVENWYPARMFLGQGGSLFIGYMLGTLSVMSGTKVITTLLIIGIPLLDALWVVARRVLIEHRSPFSADRKHFHHRLLDVGFTQEQAAATVLVATALFGILAYLLQTREKVYALVVLVFLMLIAGGILIRKERYR